MEYSGDMSTPFSATFPFPDLSDYTSTGSNTQSNLFNPTSPGQRGSQQNHSQQDYASYNQGYNNPFAFSDPSSGSSSSNNLGTPFNNYHQTNSINVPPLPIHIESAFSPHPSWGGLPQQQQQQQQQQSFDRGRVTISGWEVDVDPSTIPSSGPTFGDYNPVPAALPPLPVPISSRFRSVSFGKGKEVDEGEKGRWGEDFGNDLKRQRMEAETRDVERDIALLQTYLTELIHLMSPFATSPEQPSPPVPPPYLHTRFSRLSNLVHTTLLSLSPHIHPYLHPSFDLPLPGGKSSAEKDMEIIRKRRDELIAKAKGTPAERNTEPGDSVEPVISVQSDERPKNTGRCHGCGVGVTHEWRRGPDGPKSLCDSCGLHYEKLSRRRSGTGKEEAQESVQLGPLDTTLDVGSYWTGMN